MAYPALPFPVKVVILVPLRAGRPDRDRLWAFCRTWWQEQHPGIAIVEGHHEEDEGLFNRSAAVNRAAFQAGSWDVAVLIDADVICDTSRVHEAIDLAVSTGRMVLPFTVRYNLSPVGSDLVMRGERGSWKPYVHRTYHEMVSSTVVLPRSLWNAVGGFDDRFVGWGWEDTAFAAAAETLVGPIFMIRGELWHLHHATAVEGRPNTPTWRANKARAGLYEAAWGDRVAMQALVDRSPLAAVA